jgi:glycerol-3-phosphate dehydrogenase (NAD(P)+)
VKGAGRSSDSGALAIRRAVVLGDGAWGTTLACLLDANGVHATLWCRTGEQSTAIAHERENRAYLPGVRLSESIATTCDAFEAVREVDVAISAIPTQYLRHTIEGFEDALGGAVPIATATKGLEIETFRTPSEILLEVLGARSICVLTGPSHAEEVARGLPAAILAASEDGALARALQRALSSASFRVYTHDDPRGAELAGALKNVIAIAAGISDGLGLGDNAKAALVTRGMVEMARFGQAHGARSETFFGLAGVGDLVTTCYSRYSRNRHVGEELGRGRKLEDILREMRMVAEGVWTTRALFGPESEARGIPMPIAEQVHAILFEGKDPRLAVGELMRREPTGEMDGLSAVLP